MSDIEDVLEDSGVSSGHMSAPSPMVDISSSSSSSGSVSCSDRALRESDLKPNFKLYHHCKPFTQGIMGGN